jgi:hypothetical protein
VTNSIQYTYFHLVKVDHDSIQYDKVRKNFYIESPAISELTDEEVEKIREEKQVKIRGKKCPKPVNTWAQCGLSDKVITPPSLCPSLQYFNSIY